LPPQYPAACGGVFIEAGSLIGKTAELHVTHMVARNVGVRLQGKVFPAAAAK